MQGFLSQLVVWGPVAVLAVSGAMSAASTVLPKADTSSPTWNAIRQVVDFLALNFGNAKNAK